MSLALHHLDDRTHTVAYPGDPDTWKTIVFTTLCIAQMGHALAVRSVNKLVIEINPFSNPLLLWAILGTILLQLAVVYIAPLRWRSLPKVIVFWDSSFEFT
jgi:P-type Ca2+ transporter type 2C